MQNFQALGALLPDPQNSPPIANFWLRTWQLFTVYNYMLFRSFCFKQFFLIVQSQTYDVNYRCMSNVNCFLFKKFYLNYALCDFDSIPGHCTRLYIRQSIDREQIFDVTFEPLLPLKNPTYAPGLTNAYLVSSSINVV